MSQKKQKLELTRIGTLLSLRGVGRLPRWSIWCKKRGQPFRITPSQLREVGMILGLSRRKSRVHLLNLPVHSDRETGPAGCPFRGFNDVIQNQGQLGMLL